MLFRVFIAFALFYSLSAKISCYDCSSVRDIYNYIVTTDTIPRAFGDCPIRKNQDMCYISLRWLLTSNQTGIFVRSIGDGIKTSFSEHFLGVSADLIRIDEQRQNLQHSFTYFCLTDRCNDINTFKRLLYSLTITDQFVDIKDRLIPVEPFDGHWCMMFSNKTSSDPCDMEISVDPSNCIQCSTQYMQDSIGNRMCAGCFTDRIHAQSLFRYIKFDMIDRTSIDRSFINCQSNNCNGVETMQLIREKSTIKFNFDKFFNDI
ncbi:hypothetical protein I4U23_010970 [Adineta vaga]|nr:hypothetical protein I4U23_010970 [Adineta vaga]